MPDDPRSQAILQSVLATRLEWERRLAQNETEILGVFLSAETEMATLLERLSTNGEMDATAMTEIRASLAGRMNRLRSDLAAGVGRAVAFGAQSGLASQVDSLGPLLPAGMRAGLTEGREWLSDVVASVMNRTTEGLQLSSRIWRLTAELEGDVQRAVATGLAMGESPHQIAARLRSGLTGLELQPGTRVGQYRSAFDNYMRIARTESMRAYAEAALRWGAERPWAQFVRYSLSSAHPDFPSSPDVCFPAGTMIMTNAGEVPIEDIVAGDEVVTHLGRVRRVAQTHRRTIHEGQLLRVLALEGKNRTLSATMTPAHPVLTALGWLPAASLRTGMTIACLHEDTAEQLRQLAYDGSGTASLNSGESEPWQGPGNCVEELRGEPVNPSSLRICRIHDSVPSHTLQKTNAIFAGADSTPPSSLDCFLPSFQATAVASLPNDVDSRGGSRISVSNISYRIAGETTYHRPCTPSTTQKERALEVSTVQRASPNDVQSSVDEDTAYVFAHTGRSNTFADREQSCSFHNQGISSRLASIASNDDTPAEIGLATVTLVETFPFCGDVFNLTVEDDNTYTANGIVVHNCDSYATQDLFGVGPGVYPRTAFPLIPAHPQCTCLVSAVADFDMILGNEPGIVPMLNLDRLQDPAWTTAQGAERWTARFK